MSDKRLVEIMRNLSFNNRLNIPRGRLDYEIKTDLLGLRADFEAILEKKPAIENILDELRGGKEEEDSNEGVLYIKRKELILLPPYESNPPKFKFARISASPEIYGLQLPFKRESSTTEPIIMGIGRLTEELPFSFFANNEDFFGERVKYHNYMWALNGALAEYVRRKHKEIERRG